MQLGHSLASNYKESKKQSTLETPGTMNKLGVWRAPPSRCFRRSLLLLAQRYLAAPTSFHTSSHAQTFYTTRARRVSSGEQPPPVPEIETHLQNNTPLEPVPVVRAKASSKTGRSAPTTTSGPQLRPYQEECVQDCLTAFQEGKRRIAVSLATGGGKTMIFTHLIHRVKPLTPNRNKVLVIAHRKELIQQAYATACSVYPDLNIEIEMGKQTASGEADITIATIQTLSRGDRLHKFNSEEFKMVIIDEAHHAAAKSYLNVLDYFGAGNESTDTYVVGFSATLERLDGLQLGKAMDHIVYHRGVVEMIEEGHLCDIRVTTVKVDIDYDEVGTKNGDFEINSLARAVDIENINDLVYKGWRHQTNVGKYKSTLAFCVNVSHVQSLSKKFREKGVHSEYVTAETPADERAAILADFKAGKFPVLINCGILTEGTDIPNIDCILLVRPTKSRALLTQMVGRGLRKHGEKEHCHIVDYVGITNTGVCTMPTLMGLDPDEILDNARLLSLPEKQPAQDKPLNEKKAALQQEMALFTHMPGVDPTTVTLETFEGVVQFMKSSSLHKDKDQLSIHRSPHAWLKIQPGKYLLSATNAHLFLERDKETSTYELRKYTTFTDFESSNSQGKKKNFSVKKVVFSGMADPTVALAAADTYAGKNFARPLIARSAGWRMEPATEAQKKMIKQTFNKILSTKTLQEALTKVKVKPASTAAGTGEALNKTLLADDFGWVQNMTKGQGSDFLSRSKHGGLSGLVKEYVSRVGKLQGKLEKEQSQTRKKSTF